MTHVGIDRVTDVVGSIYEAAYDQERWLHAMTGMRDLLGASRACILRVGVGMPDAVSTEVDPEFNCREAVETHKRDPLARQMNSVPVGTIFRRFEIAGETYRRSEFWQDWLRPRNMFDGLACSLASSAQSSLVLDIHRGERQPAFDDAEIDLLQKLVPHVLRAGEIGRSFEKTSALASAFSHLPFGILLVDGHQRVAHLNDAAETMLTRPDSALRLKSGVLTASAPGDTRHLHRLVVDACSSLDGAMPGTGGTLVLPSQHQEPGTPRFVLSIAPYLDARRYGLASDRCAVVMIREVAAHSSNALAEHIRSVLGLTNAEAKLAASLCAGHSLKAAAAAQRHQVQHCALLS